MDIVTLRVFLTAAEVGSFSIAAEQNYLTQPAVSKRIAALERELGMRLFDRIGRRIHLTEAGQALLSRARTILAEVEDAKRSVMNLSGRLGNTLSMATSHHVGLHRLPAALKAFHARYPSVTLELHFLGSESACEAVAQGKLELAAVTLPRRAPAELEATEMWSDPLALVAAPSHPLATAKKTDAAALLAYPAILPGPGTVTRELIMSAFGKKRGDIAVGMETNYLEVLKMLTSIGFGWSALPQTMIDDELKVVHIVGINIRRKLGIVTHARRSLSNAARAMIQTIKETR